MRIRFKYYKDGKKKALTMSYDDGNRADLRLLEIFNANGIKGTFHLNSGLICDWTLSEEEMRTAYVGHEISAHTFTHPFLTCVPREQVYEEVLEDRRRLEEICGYPVCGASYPQGVYSDEIIEMLRMLGYRYCRTTKGTDSFGIPNDFMLWNPTCHHNEVTLFERLEKFKKTKRPLALFYVWGHSYEFNKDNNWDVIERFCSEAGGNDDVWYATNIEIYDYICALRALRFSVDRTMVYNPTCTDVWIEAGEKCVKIAAGASVRLEENESEEN